jgi:DNA polymerase-3 subunit gamma/tau
MVEQTAIKTILQYQIETHSFKHSYLFCGPAGCGKTTAARIFANDINNGSGNAIEVDAASNNGVEDVREIIDGSKKKPLDGAYKVYILDEVHQFSTGAWNAMLKLLEEPPKTTIFIMCTTDPQKIPATILSRVQRYDFSKISTRSIFDRLKYILDEENDTVEVQGSFKYEDAALQYIAKLSEGGMRDAITMLDKCTSLSNQITAENAVRALGTVDYATQFELLMRLTTAARPQAVTIISEVYQSGKDLKQFIKQFQYFVVDVCKYKMLNSFEYISIPELPEYAQKMEDEDFESVISVLDWVRKLNSDIKWEPNPKAIIDTAILLYGRGTK